MLKRSGSGQPNPTTMNPTWVEFFKHTLAHFELVKTTTKTECSKNCTEG